MSVKLTVKYSYTAMSSGPVLR